MTEKDRDQTVGITLIGLQLDLQKWVAHNFPGREPWEPLVGMQEELGELSHAFLKRHQNIRNNEDHNANIEDAVGDILIYLADFCNGQGIWLQDAIDEVWLKVRKRDWRLGEEPPHPFPDDDA